MTPVVTARKAARTTFQSLLQTPSFRRYFIGQGFSLTGTWIQQVASAWLVLQLTGSAVALGVQVALAFLPTLLLGAWGGIVADRLDRRKVLLATQSAFAVLAITLGLLVAFDVVVLWMVFTLSFLQGLVTAVDNPTRQSFYADMVRPKDLPNAISLNSALVTGTRILGPAIAGGLIATVGLASCFLLNGISYIAVLISLHAIRQQISVRPAVKHDEGQGGVLEGLRYVRRTPGLFGPLVLMAVLFTFSFNFSVLLPLLARETFGGGPGTFGWMMSLAGLGSLLGSLVLAHRSRPGLKLLGAAAVALGVMSIVVAWAPTFKIVALASIPLGSAMIAFMITGNATLQLRTDPAMRGRVMALFSVVFLGSTPIGAPIAGWLAQQFGPQVAISIGGTIAIVAGSIALRRRAVRLQAEADAEAAADVAADEVPPVAAEPGDATGLELERRSA